MELHNSTDQPKHRKLPLRLMGVGFLAGDIFGPWAEMVGPSF